MGDLLETYPRLGDKIGAARDAGYSDEDIQAHLQQKMQTAFKAGYSQDEVNKYLGEMPKAPSMMESIVGAATGTGNEILRQATPDPSGVVESLKNYGAERQALEDKMTPVFGPAGKAVADVAQVARTAGSLPTAVLPRGFSEAYGVAMDYVKKGSQKALGAVLPKDVADALSEFVPDVLTVLGGAKVHTMLKKSAGSPLQFVEDASKQLEKENSAKPEARAAVMRGMDQLAQARPAAAAPEAAAPAEKPPVYTSDKESPEVSAEVMRRGPQHLATEPPGEAAKSALTAEQQDMLARAQVRPQDAPPSPQEAAAMREQMQQGPSTQTALVEALARVRQQTAQNAPEQAAGELSQDFGITPQPRGEPQPAAQPAPAAGVPEGMVTLYRGQSSVKAANIPDWVRQGLKESGAADAQGRWFTDKKEIADWYAKEAGESGQIVTVSVPREVAEAARVSKNPDALKFSLDPESEYFVSKGIASNAAPEAVALKKEAVRTAERYRDPLDRPMDAREQADWEKFVKENRVREWQERDFMLGELARVSGMKNVENVSDIRGRAREGTEKHAHETSKAHIEEPRSRPPAEIPASFKAMTSEELGAILTDKKANPLGQGFARRELSERAVKSDAAKPESVDDAIARLAADNQRLSQELNLPLEDVSGDSIADHVRRLKTPRGGSPVGDTFGPQEQLDALSKRQDVENLFRKLYAETKQNGLTMEQAAAKYQIPYAQLDKMWREHLYPAEHFSWDVVEPDVLRKRLKEHDVLSQVYKNARKQNISAEQAASQMQIDPDVLRNINHEVKIDDFLSSLGGTLRDVKGLNEKSKFLLAEAEAIEKTGSIRPGSKVTRREDVRDPNSTYARKISEMGFDVTRSKVIDMFAKMRELANIQRQFGSGITAKQADSIAKLADYHARQLNKYSAKFDRDIPTWGRIGKALQRPPLPLDTIDFMKQAGVEIDSWRNQRQRTPILTSVANMMTNYANMTPGERAEGWRNLVDAPRLGIFPLTSASLDTMLNASELLAQHVSGLGADIGHGIGAGKWTFPNTKGAAMMWASLRNRIYSPEFEEAIKVTAMGEQVPGNVRIAQDIFKKPTAEGYWLDFFKTGQQGAGTYKSNQGSALLDTAWGAGMYLKGSVDTTFKRASGTMSIFTDALKAAESAGIDKNQTPLQHAQFIKDYWANIPKDALDRAADNANAAGYNRKLAPQIERIARNKGMQLFVDAFGRFPWQFGRWAVDMLGANPTILKRLGAGLKEGKWALSPEETMRYLTRAATGWGGLYLLDSHFYDKTDFQSMEYVDDDGSRMRLQGREPIASALFLSALAKGDWDKALGAAPYTSFPLLKILYGGSGLLSNLNAKAVQSGQAGRAPWEDKQVQAEFFDTINHAIPGQAVLTAIKSLTDPTVREGLGANLPGVSYLKDPKIDLTTGEPAEITQHFGGLPDVSLPTIQGTPVPGMYREMNPVAQLLFRYGESTFRGMRQPLAGKYPAEAPEDATLQWQQEFGKTRNQFLSRLVPIVQQIEARTPPDQLKPGAPVYEAILARIKSYDAMAARQANDIVNAKYQTPGKLPRKITPRELRMPNER